MRHDARTDQPAAAKLLWLLVGGIAVGAAAMFLFDLAERQRQREITDPELADKVRRALRRAAKATDPIEVSVEAGRVTLAGRIGASEAEQVLDRVGRLRGVREVINRLAPAHNGNGNLG